MPEVFFGMLGRVVMVASMLELRLLDLLTELGQAPQDEHAGKSGAVLIVSCRNLLDGNNPAFAASAACVLDRARGVLDDRNAVVHSLWSHPGADSSYGWRPITRNKRDSPGQPYGSITLNDSQLRDLSAAIAALMRDVDRVRETAAPARRSAL